MYLECTCIWFGDLKLSTPPLLNSYESIPTYIGHSADIGCLNANSCINVFTWIKSRFYLVELADQIGIISTYRSLSGLL